MTHSCPVCDSTSTEVFFERCRVPVHQNLVLETPETARAVTRGDLRFAFCHDCGFVFNIAFDMGKLSYGDHYDNTQDCSPYFSGYLDGLARYLLQQKGLNRHCIVEVGCGKGSFLRRLVEPPESKNVGYGFDPSYVGPESTLDGRLRFERRYFGPDCAHVKAEAVVCRHVIEHVPNPRRLVETVRQALAGSRSGRVFFETPCVEWILRNHVIWDFFYEHCSLFSRASLRTLFERAGFTVDSVRHVFGGQYLWMEAQLLESRPAVSKNSGAIPDLTLQFADTEHSFVQRWGETIARLAESGKVAIWGAGAKGVTFANLVDQECRLIDCVIDVNPRKQGRFIPGTAHPIVNYCEIPSRGIGAVVLMNPIYRGENEGLLDQAGIQVKLVA